MKNVKPVLNAILLLVLLCAGTAAPALAQAPPVQEPSSEKDIADALTGGVPLGRWKEGLLFEGISPQPWLARLRTGSPGQRTSSPTR